MIELVLNNIYTWYYNFQIRVDVLREISFANAVLRVDNKAYPAHTLVPRNHLLISLLMISYLY